MIIKISWPQSLYQKLVRFISYQENLARTRMINSLYLDASGRESYMSFSLKISQAMKACGSLHSLPDARKLHAYLIYVGLESSVFLQNHLLEMYSNSGSIDDARRVFNEIKNPNVFTWNTMINGLAYSGRLTEARQRFDEIPERDSVSWNSMMSGYFRNGQPQESIAVFLSMARDFECQPDPFSLSLVMKACGILQFIELASQLHGFAVKMDFVRDVYVETSILDMYVKCGAMNSAEQVFQRIQNPNLLIWNSMILGHSKSSGVEVALKVFHQMPARDTVSWNTVISILSQHGFGTRTLCMFIEMCKEGFRPDSTTYASVLSACTSILDLDWGRHLHARAVRCESSYLDVFMGSGLIDMYSKCGRLEDAKRVFNSLNEHNAVSWTSLIGGFTQFGLEEEALILFNRMREEGAVMPDQFTLATVVRACSGKKDNFLGTQLHGYIYKTGMDSSVPVSNALVTMYAKCGSVEIANHLFESMPIRDVISWTVMITAFSQMGDVENARAYFNKMPNRNVISWNSMLASYIQHGYGEEGIKFYTMMQREDDVKPDSITFVTLLGACADYAMLRLGNQIIAQAAKVVGLGLNRDVSVANGIVTMYSRCGQIEKAREVFDSIIDKDLISWNTMMAGYGLNGQGTKVIEIFEDMLKMESAPSPDYISYISVLSGCGHSGLVSEGQFYFDCMTKKHGISPRTEHFVCMVDLLGRAGLLEQAKHMIDETPIEPSAGVWGALLSACRIHGNTKLAEAVVKNLVKLDPNDSGSYILLSNIYSDSSKLDGVAEVRKRMREKKIRKNPGCSWIEVENRVHVFTADDKNHPNVDVIHRKVEEIIRKIGDAGHHLSFSVYRSRGYHSEMLAVAFGLISLPAWMPILVMKNLRVCNDCHTFIKLTSLVFVREFTVRDANRFHHFKQGSCSCGDYW